MTLLALGDPYDRLPSPLHLDALLTMGAEMGLFRRTEKSSYRSTETGNAHWLQYYYARMGKPYPPPLDRKVDMAKLRALAEAQRR